MTQILSGIWQNAPVWVWPLFFVLLGIGILSMKNRNSSIIPYFFYPLFGLSAAGAVGGLVHTPTNWVIFGIAYLVGMAVAFRWQDGLIVAKTGWNMRLQGDRFTIVLLMTIFFANFVSGVLTAVSPDTLQALTYTIIFASILGACSGSFTGRALRVVTLGNRNTDLMV